MYTVVRNHVSPFEKLVVGGLCIFVLSKLLEGNESDSFTRVCKPRVFISHSWKYDQHYEQLKCKLTCGGLDYYDHSIPKYRKVKASNATQIRAAIKSKIRGCSTVVVSGGMYANNYWIKEEVKIAQELGKKIVVVKPRGSKKTPKYLNSKDIKIIGSYTPSVINSIQCIDTF